MKLKKSTWRYGLSTHKGSVRNTNEDNAYLNTKVDRKGNELLVTVVADGMGGYEAGEIASQMVVTKLDTWFRKKASAILALPYPFTKIASEMEMLLKEINEDLLQEAKDSGKKIGTTASVLFLYKDTYFIIHVGDSRVYQLSDRNEEQQHDLTQLTEDHSWVMDQVRKKLLTVEEAEHHPKKNVIMQCLGINEGLSPLTMEGTFSKKDIFFLCSDGFYNIYPIEALVDSFQTLEDSEQSYQSLADFLVNDADVRGATDNITVSIVTPK
ncbi:PP2C family protein-serine/threonine phosphatase [Gracilibacillus massiliensis]|uniref:PP2C family protein-serine/threonine phosphatase n=1 Tax=Gracilibacillus massiliensis TaxID=1564956 RepID=UPI00071C5C46|nr:protein phosphatase 2C domain-containing protein [Gracilibacillus massiliensis]